MPSCLAPIVIGSDKVSEGDVSVAGTTGYKDLKMALNEEIVKGYWCSSSSQPPCNGYLIVTTQRVILLGVPTGSSQLFKSRIVQEVPISSVSGIDAFYGGKFVLWKALVGIIAAILGIVMIFNGFSGLSSFFGFSWIFGIILVGIGAVILKGSYRNVFHIKIYSPASSAPIKIGEGYGGIFGNTALFALIAEPTSRTDAMMLELGALIRDISKGGHDGFNNWVKSGSKIEDRIMR